MLRYLNCFNSFSAEFEAESTASLGALLGAKRTEGSCRLDYFFSGTIDFRLGMLVLVGKVSS